MRVTDEGNVGIGTDAPNTLMHVVGESFAGAVRITDDSGSNLIMSNPPDDMKWVIQNSYVSGGKLRFIYNSVDQMTYNPADPNYGDVSVFYNAASISFLNGPVGLANGTYGANMDNPVVWNRMHFFDATNPVNNPYKRSVDYTQGQFRFFRENREGGGGQVHAWMADDGTFSGLFNVNGAHNLNGKLEVISALPGTPDANTIYFVTG